MESIKLSPNPPILVSESSRGPSTHSTSLSACFWKGNFTKTGGHPRGPFLRLRSGQATDGLCPPDLPVRIYASRSALAGRSTRDEIGVSL